MAGRLVKVYGKFQPENCLNHVLTSLLEEACHHPSVSPSIRIFDRSFSFLTDGKARFAMKFCFSVFAIVFHGEDQLRPWVAHEALELLWEALILNKDMQYLRQSLINYRLKRVSHVIDLMIIMGLFDVSFQNSPRKTRKKKYYRLHHDLMWLNQI